MKKNILIIILLFLLFLLCLFIPYGSGKLLQSMNNSNISRNFTFSSAGDQMFWISLPKNASVISASLNVSGFQTINDTFTFINSTKIYTANDLEGIWVNSSTIVSTDQVLNTLDTHMLNGTKLGNNFTLASTNGIAKGVSFNGTFYYVADSTKKKIYVYNLSGGTDGNIANITLTGNKFPLGIDENQSHIFVVIRDADNATAQMYAYLKDDNSLSFTIPLSQFTLDDTATYGGISYSPYYVWITKIPTIYKYNLDWTYTGVSKTLPSNWIGEHDTDDGITFYAFGNTSTSTAINIYSLTPTSSLTNLTLDISNDGDAEFNHTGDFTTNNQTADFSGEINAYLSTCTAINGNCTIPINITTASAGIVQINNINIVYLIPPNVTLISPNSSGSIYQANAPINFNCSATSDTDPLYNITLWHNISGSWVQNMSKLVGAASNYSNFTLITPLKGKFIYNCLVSNVNGSNHTKSFAPSNYSFEIDITEPYFTNNATWGTYKYHSNFTANITIGDNLALNFTIFSTNVTGTWTNDTAIPLKGLSSYRFNNSKNITIGYPKNVCWKVHANDTSNNTNTSLMWCFDIANTAPLFNETTPTWNIDSKSTLSFDFNCTDPDGSDVTFSDNTTLFNINANTGVVTDSPAETENGTYAINITCSDGTDSVSQYPVYRIGDLTAPQITIPENYTPLNYSPILLSDFNITLISGNGGLNKTYIAFNYTGTWVNYTLGSLGSNKYNYTKILAVGSYAYYFWTNDSYNNINYSSTFSFTINKNDSLIVLLFNGTQRNLRINYSYGSVNMTARKITGDTNNLTLYMNATRIYSQLSEYQWTHNTTSLFSNLFCINYTATANYTSTSNCSLLTIVDEIQPYFTNNLTKGTFRFNSNFTANLTVNDGFNLSYAWFATNNSGVWTNTTPVAISGLTYQFNTSLNITLTRGYEICYYFHANDTSNNTNTSLMWCFDIANTVPTITSATINDTAVIDSDDLLCLNGTVTDVDNDTVTLYYDWINNSKSISLNSQILGNGNTSTNDIWECRIWAGDSFENSSNVTSASISVGTNYVAPLINFTNATTAETGKQSNSINPTNNNSYIYLSVAINDTNTGDRWTTFFCTANSFSAGNCTTGYLCNTNINSTNTTPKCFLNVTNYASGEHTYYAFVLDNTSLVSTSKSGTYEINTYPQKATLTSPANGSFINKNWVYLEFIATDLEDGYSYINYTIMSNKTGTWVLNQTTPLRYWNFTGLPENLSVYINISTYDIHNYYNPEISNVYYFTTDYTAPYVSITSPRNSTTYTNAALNITVSHSLAISDLHLASCYYNLTTSAGGIIIPNYAFACSTPPATLSIDVVANNLRYNLFVNDSAGNSNIQTVVFNTAYDTTSPGGGGGGGGGTSAECSNNLDCINKWGDNYYCNIDKCIFNESKVIIQPTCGDGVCQPEFQEDIIQCPQDCSFNSTILSSCFDENIENNYLCIWQQKWFLSLSLLLLLLAIIYLAYYRRRRKKKNG